MGRNAVKVKNRDPVAGAEPAMVRVDRVSASLFKVRRTSCAVRSRSGTFPISIVIGRSRSTCDRTVLSASPSSASAAQSSTALATV
jgi:hypothetical protein